MDERPDPLKRHSLALFLAAACAGFPLRLCAANPNPTLFPLAAGAWLVFDQTLLNFFLALAIGALLMVAVLKRRHRPELLVVCLALSIVLHLLSLSMFSILPVRNTRLESALVPEAGIHRIKVGLPPVRESLVSQGVRAELPKTEVADQHAQLETDRAARSEPIPNAPVRTPADLRENEMRTAEREEIKTPAPTPPKQALDEALKIVSPRPVEVAGVKIPVPQQDRNMPQAKPEESKAREPKKEFQVAPVAQASATPLTAQPDAPRAGLKDSSQAPARAKIVLAAAVSRQLEVKDALQPAVAKSAVDRLEVRAVTVDPTPRSGPEQQVATVQPGAEVKLDKREGAAPRLEQQSRPAAAQSASRPRMASDSLAVAGPDGIERKKSEVVSIAPTAPTAATRLEPMPLSGLPQALVVADRPVKSEKAPTDQRAWPAAKEQSVGRGIEATAAKPRAELTDAARSTEPTSMGLGREALAVPASKAPAVQEIITGAGAGGAGLTAMGDPLPGMTPLTGEQRAPDQVADKLGPSALAIEKQNAALGGAGVAVARPATDELRARRAVGNSGVVAGTLIAEAGRTPQPRDSAAGEIQERLTDARSGAEGRMEAGLADMGSPAQAVVGVARGAATGEPAAGPAALVTARAQLSGAPAGSGEMARPEANVTSDLPVSQDSFVGQGGGGGGIAAPQPQVASSPVAGGEQIAAPPAAVGGGGDVKILAGRINVAPIQGGNGASAGGGSGAAGSGSADLVLEKSGGGQVGVAAGPGSGKRWTASGSAAGGQADGAAGTLVGKGDLPAAGGVAKTGTQGESLAAVHTSIGAAGAGAVGSPALAARTVAQGAASASGAGSDPEGGIAPIGSLAVAKAGGTDVFQADGEAGGGTGGGFMATTGGAAERAPGRMDLRSSAVSSKAPVSSDISVSSAERPTQRSFLSVGNAPNPESVSEKAIYRMRKPEKRRQFIAELGGTPQTEEAVEQALLWLNRAQSADGRWDVDGFKTLKECGGAGDLAKEDVAVTGMTLLAYLGAGYTHLEGAHQESVRKGLDWMLNVEKENGDFRGAGQMYGQAIATAVLCESYSLTGDQRLLAPARRAVQFIVDSQTPESGWRYEARDNSDTSVTGWQILALKSASIAGIAVPEQTFKWTALWLDKVRQGNEGGLYTFKPGHIATPVMTAEGTFCQLFMSEQERTRGQNESIAFLMQALPVWNPDKRSVHMYYWYYATLALYLSGAKEFTAWNSALTEALLSGRSGSGPAAGSWDPVCDVGARGGRVYSTAMGALCLEVYYRFMPLYKQK